MRGNEQRTEVLVVSLRSHLQFDTTEKKVPAISSTVARSFHFTAFDFLPKGENRASARKT